MTESKSRRAMRDRKLADLGPRPSWRHPILRRRWDERHAAIMAIDTSEMAEVLAGIYTPEWVNEMANRPSLAMLPKEPK